MEIAERHAEVTEDIRRVKPDATIKEALFATRVWLATQIMKALRGQGAVKSDGHPGITADRATQVIRAGCIASDIHLTCSYPKCGCRQMPRAILAAIAEWEAPLTRT